MPGNIAGSTYGLRPAPPGPSRFARPLSSASRNSFPLTMPRVARVPGSAGLRHYGIAGFRDLPASTARQKETETGSHAATWSKGLPVSGSARAARDFGKFRFCGCALQYAEMRVGKNRPHLQLPSFLRTCLTGICIGGAQKQCVPKQFLSKHFCSNGS